MASPPSPLAALHAELGVRRREQGGRSLPGGYGPLAGEHRALVEGRAVAERPWLEVIELRGADRQRFLHGLVTCDVLGLAAGRSSYGFVTSVQGRVLAETVVLATADALRLELPLGSGAMVAAHLHKYLIADRVSIAAKEDEVAVTLFGPEAEAAAGSQELVPEPDSVAPASLFAIPVLADRRRVWGMPALTLWVPAAQAAPFFRRLLEASRCVGVVPVGLDALETRRVELGIPRFGRDFGPDQFPQETGLEEVAVSYSKGCYLGQEVVARIHYRGQANRLMRGLLLPAGIPPPADGTEVSFEGRPLGSLSSVVDSPALGRRIALAVLHRRGAEPGTRVEVAEATAEVAALPFVS